MQRIDFLTKRATGMVKSTETVKNVVLTLCLSHDFNDFFLLSTLRNNYYEKPEISPCMSILNFMAGSKYICSF